MHKKSDHHSRNHGSDNGLSIKVKKFFVSGGRKRFHGKLRGDENFLQKSWFYIRMFWDYVWNDDSAFAFLLNILIAFLLVKFVIYPGVGLLLGTDYPVVAVVSSSMDHNPIYDGSGYKLCGNSYPVKPNADSIDNWWTLCGKWYEKNNITLEEFKEFPLSNGFRRGDLIVLTSPKNVQRGDIIVFLSPARVRPDPIIHRLIFKRVRGSNISDGSNGSNSSVGEEFYVTKGDNNPQSYPGLDSEINKDEVYGKALFKVPYLGYVKIIFVELLAKLGINII